MRNAAVFEATQFINSMLGLVGFPQLEHVESIPRTPLEELQREGWPIPQITGTVRQAFLLSRQDLSKDA